MHRSALSSPSTALPARAKAHWRARWPTALGIATSTPAPCIARSRGRRCTTGCRWTTRRVSRSLRRDAALDIDDGRVVIDGHDVTRAIRTPEIDKAAAASRGCPVRDALVARQRALGAVAGSSWKAAISARRLPRRGREGLSRRVSRRTRAAPRRPTRPTTGQQGTLAGVQSELQARDKSDSKARRPADAGEGRRVYRYDRHADSSRWSIEDIVGTCREQACRAKHET